MMNHTANNSFKTNDGSRSFRVRRAASLALALLLLSVSALGAMTQTQRTQSRANAASPMSAEHTAALQQWLQTKRGLRVATDSDCENKEGLKSMRQSFGKRFQPYYLVKDFNGDAVNDFAVALIDSSRKADSQFTLVIFHGKRNANAKGQELSDSGAFQVVFTQESIDLRQGGLFAGELERERTPLYVGIFETDDCSRLKWNGKRYTLNPCEGN